MRMLVAGTDLSPRSDRALHRAALLARQLQAGFALLHVVDDDQPTELIEKEISQATTILEGRAVHLAELAYARPEILVEAGNPFQIIMETAKERNADLVVMGAHRKRALRDIFIGTTVERVIRTGNSPVLMVNAEPVDRYHRAILAVDLSDASARTAQIAKSLAFLGATDITILHAFMPYAKARLASGGEGDYKYVGQTSIEAAGALASFLIREGLHAPKNRIILEEGDPFGTILHAVEQRRPDLLIIGTRGHTGLKRILLGSVADEVLRQVECDVLAIPPGADLVPLHPYSPRSE